MSLDATAYCDCYERGRLRSGPPGGAAIEVCPDGSLSRAQGPSSLEEDLAFDRWLLDSACAHENGVLLLHHLGNFSLAALLREELAHEPDSFSMILKKVVYNGVHSGDFIPPTQLPILQEEVYRLQTFRCRRERSKEIVANFAAQMLELVEAATTIQKPISF